MSTKSEKEIEETVVEQEHFEEPMEQEDEFVTFKKSHFYAVISVLTFVLGIGVGYLFWGSGLVFDKGSGTAPQADVPVVEAPVEAQPEFVRYDVPSEGHYAIGPENAPIVIVEFSDYQCPYCRRWHEQVYQPLLNEYPGQIRLVYRHLPLTSIHPDAFPAAEAAMCAGEQNAYWPFHEKLFSSESLGSSIYMQYARDLDLDMTAFESCLTDRKYQEAVQADLDFAVNLGVRSTPTFFINGLAIVGAQPLDVFKQVIDQERAGEIP
ncbi:MAG TPA: DsbA family protein [Anaerolineales bacterium]|nr:DsbA family protein [Anaerolineales bacterium]